LRATGIDPEISQARKHEERKLMGEAPQVTKIEEFIAEVHGLLIFDRAACPLTGHPRQRIVRNAGVSKFFAPHVPEPRIQSAREVRYV
jgi:hypothetical protein